MTIAIDYSLYLVTSRNLLPLGKDFLESLEESLQGGVTVVQIREKEASTLQFLEIARKSKEICQRYNVPIIINDRIDIALAIQANGVHLGQEDMPVAVARRLLPKGVAIGVSCNTTEQAKKAIADGADYIGVGAVYATNTKKLTQPVISVRGIRPILRVVEHTAVKAVAIGGIKSFNLLRTLQGSVTHTGRHLDGIAVVSEVVASRRPLEAAKLLSRILNEFRRSPSVHLGLGIYGDDRETARKYDVKMILDSVLVLMDAVREHSPLVHQITNTVVSTQSANVTLALGSSPIMATSPDEMEDLSRICNSLLVNIGTLTQDTKQGMLRAGTCYNAARKPVILDPVGIGASEFRKNSVNDLLDAWAPSVIKGNAGELSAFAGSIEVASKGVDSIGPGFKDPATFVRALARKERCIIVLTGETDYISDGHSVIALSNGHPIMGDITGSGCILGSCIAAYCAAAVTVTPVAQRDPGKLVDGDILLGAVAGTIALTVAGEIAAERECVLGPGTFLPVLVDCLHHLKPETVRQRLKVNIR